MHDGCWVWYHEKRSGGGKVPKGNDRSQGNDSQVCRTLACTELACKCREHEKEFSWQKVLINNIEEERNNVKDMKTVKLLRQLNSVSISLPLRKIKQHLKFVLYNLQNNFLLKLKITLVAKEIVWICVTKQHYVVLIPVFTVIPGTLSDKDL